MIANQQLNHHLHNSTGLNTTMLRRASTGAAPATVVDVLGDPFPQGFGTDDEDDDEMTLKQSHRRASFSGAVAPIARRRGSNESYCSNINPHVNNHDVAENLHCYDGNNNRNDNSKNVSHSHTLKRSNSHEGNAMMATGNSTRGGRRADYQGRDSFIQPSKTASRGGGYRSDDSKGINPDIVAKMSFRQNYGSQDEDDDDDDDDDGPQFQKSNAYGYNQYSNSSGIDSSNQNHPHHHTKSHNKSHRRPSAASSVKSRASRRGSSNGITALRDSRKQDPLAAAGLYPPKFKKNVYDSDPDDQEEPSNNSEQEDDNNMPSSVTNASYMQSYGYEDHNDPGKISDSEQSQASISSSKRSRRRNSCLIRPGQDVTAVLIGDPLRAGGMMSDRDMEAQAEEEEDDPDSLWNRALKGYAKKTTTMKPVGSRQGGREGVQGNSREATDTEDNALLFEDLQNCIVRKPAPLKIVTTDKPSPSNDAVANATLEISDAKTTFAVNVKVKPEQTWRKTPMTVSYAAPTAENLRASLMNLLSVSQHEPVLGATNKHQKNKLGGGIPGWGDMDVQNLDDASSNPESSNVESDQSYGESMYTTVVIPLEIDSYQQKARRRDSMENTCVDIDNYVKSAAATAASQDQGAIKVPNFKPADGCRNASDFVVRCFSARMRISGFVVLKHNRSRWSKAKYREIFLLPDCKTLTWKEVELDADGNPAPTDNTNTTHSNNVNASNDGGTKKSTSSSKKKRHPRIDLSSCLEIRHAWSADPLTKNKTGTSVLRSRCKESLAGKSFSLIFAKRTLDFTAFSNDQCKVLMEGFSALCFRLQLKAIEDGEDRSDHSSRVLMSDEDWVSTIYGGSTVESTTLTNTNTNNSNVPAVSTPWGC